MAFTATLTLPVSLASCSGVRTRASPCTALAHGNTAGRRRGCVAARVQAPRGNDLPASPRASNTAEPSTLNPFADDCVERTETDAYKAVAMDYFAQVGQAEPDLRSVMLDECVMTDRVLGWCFRGREAVEGHFRDFFSKYSSHEFSHLDVLTNLDERTVCAHWALTVVTRDSPVPDHVEATADKLGAPIPGKETFQLSGVHLFTLDSDNKIANIVTYRTECNADSKFCYT